MRFRNQKQGEPDMRWNTTKTNERYACHYTDIRFTITRVGCTAMYWNILMDDLTVKCYRPYCSPKTAKRACERVAKQLGILV